MVQSEIQIRVRYSETDRMGYVYYGNYAAYLEVARVEALRSLGITYKDLEDQGVLLPVSEYQIRYLKPAYYDEVLIIKTVIPGTSGVRLLFNYEVLNASGDLLAVASTTLVFVTAATGKPCAPPEEVVQLLSRAS
jgi:acyl-CoA thioester hydrolase